MPLPRPTIRILTALLLLICATDAQQYDQGGGYYDDYANQGQDTLYHDYAARQQDKAVASPLPWGKLLLSGGIGWMLGGKFHSRRLKKKLDAKHKQEQKALYQQYYQDVSTLQQNNADLVNALEQYGVRVR